MCQKTVESKPPSPEQSGYQPILRCQHKRDAEKQLFLGLYISLPLYLPKQYPPPPPIKHLEVPIIHILDAVLNLGDEPLESLGDSPGNTQRHLALEYV